MTLTTSGINYSVELAFTTDPLGVPGAWTDVTDYVRAFSTRRGRNHELGKTSAGVATITLDNRDRRFDPTYTSSPYYPNVVPMRHVRIRATYLAVTYPVFYGFVEDWGQTWPEPAANTQGDAVIEMQAVDAFKVFSMLRLTAYPAAVAEDGPVAYYPLTEGVAGPAIDVAGENPGTYEGTVLFEAGPLIGSPFAPDLSAGYVTLPNVDTFDDLGDKTMSVECWVRPESLASSGSPLFGDEVWYLTMGSGGDLSFGYGSANPADNPQVVEVAALTVNTWAHVVGVRDWEAGTLTLYVDGAEVATAPFGRFRTEPAGFTDYTIGRAGAFPFLGRVSHAAFYDKALSPARVAAHYAAGLDDLEAVASGTAIGDVLDAAGWPVGLRDLDAGASSVTMTPTGSALDLIQQIAEDTEQGLVLMSGDNTVTFVSRTTLEATLSAVATFGDGAGETPYRDLLLSYDDQDLWTEVSASGADDSVVLVSDAAASARYGLRTLEVSGAASSANEVADIANGLLNRYKAPAVRPTSMVLGKPASFVQQLSRLIGERVTVKRRPPGGGTITTDAFIEGIDHDAGPDGYLTTTFALVPVEPQAFWILADSTYGVLGSTTRLGW